MASREKNGGKIRKQEKKGSNETHISGKGEMDKDWIQRQKRQLAKEVAWQMETEFFFFFSVIVVLLMVVFFLFLFLFLFFLSLLAFFGLSCHVDSFATAATVVVSVVSRLGISGVG